MRNNNNQTLNSKQQQMWKVLCIPPVHGPGHEYYLMYPMMARDHHVNKRPTPYNKASSLEVMISKKGQEIKKKKKKIDILDLRPDSRWEL